MIHRPCKFRCRWIAAVEYTANDATYACDRAGEFPSLSVRKSSDQYECFRGQCRCQGRDAYISNTPFSKLISNKNIQVGFQSSPQSRWVIVLGSYLSQRTGP